jgi:two-component system nitrate/nitrite response regulator NarL
MTLTAREQEVAALMVQGRSHKDIGYMLGMSPRTSEVHVKNICKKLGVRSRIEAIVRLLTSPSHKRDER